MKQVLGASDPSVSGDTLAYAKGAGDLSFVREGQNETGLPGTDPSISDEFVAVIDGAERPHPRAPRLRRGRVLRRSWRRRGGDLEQLARYRTRVEARDTLQRRDRSIEAGETGEPKDDRRCRTPRPGERPGPRRQHARLRDRDPEVKPDHQGEPQEAETRRRDPLRPHAALNPSVRGSSLLYVRGTKQDWELRLKRLGSRDSGRLLEQQRQAHLVDRAQRRSRLLHGARRAQRRPRTSSPSSANPVARALPAGCRRSRPPGRASRSA